MPAQTVTLPFPASQVCATPDPHTPHTPTVDASVAELLDPIPRIILANSVNLLAGAPGVGKTALLSWLLTRFSRQLPIFGYAVNPIPKVAIITTDRSWARSTRLWFDAVGFGDIVHYALLDDTTFNPRNLRKKFERITVLERCLDKLGDLPFGSLVAIDPAGIFLGGNMIDYDSCIVACAEMRALCLQRGVTVIGSVHSAKQKADTKDRYLRLQDRILGSTGLHGYTDTQMYLASPEETGERHYTFLWAPHHAPTELFSLGRDDQGLFVPWAESETVKTDSKILQILPLEEPGLSFNEILVGAELSKTTGYRQLQDLVKSGRVVKVGHGRYRKAAVN